MKTISSLENLDLEKVMLEVLQTLAESLQLKMMPKLGLFAYPIFVAPVFVAK